MAHHAVADVHPLDWTFYLHQALVMDPVPTVLTLLIVTSHFYGCCSVDTLEKSHAVHSHHATSVLDALFGSLPSFFSSGASSDDSKSSSAQSWFGSLADSWTTLWVKHCAIRTPVSSRSKNKSNQRVNVGGESGSFCKSTAENLNVQDNLDESRTLDVKDSQSIKDSIISVAMTDPISMMYDMWFYLSASDAEIADASPDANTYSGFTQTENTSQESASDNHAAPEMDAGEDDGILHSGHNLHINSDVWMDICIMHAICMAGMAVALFPSILKPSGLASSCMPRVKMSAWPVLNSCVMVTGMSLIMCCALQYLLGMAELALCLSMHSTCRILASYASTCMRCPLPPVFMPTVAASGMGMCIGLLMLFVSQMMRSSASEHVIVTSESFYMCHAWACCVALLGARHTVFRLSVFGSACVQREVVRAACAGE